MAGRAGGRIRGGKRLVHDTANGACAPPALRTATETMINLARRARDCLACRQRCAHVMIGEHVAGADNHRDGAGKKLVRSATISSALDQAAQRKNLSL